MEPARISCEYSRRDSETIAIRGRTAQKEISNWTQEQVDQAVGAAGWHAYCEGTARRLSQMAVSETRFGKFDDTLKRYRSRILGVLRDLNGLSTVGLIDVDVKRGMMVFAKPVGLIGVMIPSTAPASAVVINALGMLKTRNAAIFCPNPRAWKTVAETVEVLRRALNQIGAPEDVFQCIANPSREHSMELAKQVDLLIATGGAGTVRRALCSGVPAYGGGTGNSVVIVDETADISAAAGLIVDGKSFDNGTSCSSESSVVVSNRVLSEFLAAATARGAHLCNKSDLQKLRKVIWPNGTSVSREVVGQDAINIAKLAGINVPPETRILVGFPEGPPGEDLMSYEKLSPVLALWVYDDPFGTAIAMTEKLISCSGCGHSCGIHTSLVDRVISVADSIRVGRVMVNQSTCFGNSGSFQNGMPFSSTLSCGTWAGALTTENINWRHFLNYTRVSKTIDGESPDPQLFFSDHWAKYGR